MFYKLIFFMRILYIEIYMSLKLIFIFFLNLINFYDLLLNVICNCIYDFYVLKIINFKILKIN